MFNVLNKLHLSNVLAEYIKINEVLTSSNKLVVVNPIVLNINPAIPNNTVLRYTVHDYRNNYDIKIINIVINNDIKLFNTTTYEELYNQFFSY